MRVVKETTQQKSGFWQLCCINKRGVLPVYVKISGGIESEERLWGLVFVAVFLKIYIIIRKEHNQGKFLRFSDAWKG